MKDKINYWAIAVYYIIAVICRYLTKKGDLLNGISNEYVKSILTGVGPALGAVFVFSVFNIKPFMTLKGNYRNIIFPMALYWAFPVIFITTVTYFLNGTLPYIAVFSVLMYGLFEEVGWRGFLYQELKGLSTFLNIFIVSVLWYVWHLDFEWSFVHLSFFAIVIVGSWGIGKVADATNSLLAVSAFHSLNNFFRHIHAVNGLILGILLTSWILILVVRKQMREKHQNSQVAKRAG